MGKFSSILTERLRKSDKSNKMASLAETSSEGRLSGFSGVFSVANLSEEAHESLRDLLEKHATEQGDHVEKDLRSLVAITCEVQAINNQAALLHGERIKKAQTLLKNYKEGAFSAWLVTTYGNRQTPYNFLQYWDFHQALPATLHKQIEAMPRQAIYSLASRAGDQKKKENIVKQYDGQTKSELLSLIRETFPLPESDLRRKNDGEGIVSNLKRIHQTLNQKLRTLSKKQRMSALQVAEDIYDLLEGGR